MIAASQFGPNSQGGRNRHVGRFLMIRTITGALLCTAMTFAFVLPTAAKDKVLVTLTGANGEDVATSMIQGSDGNLYGTTAWGGANSEGTVFKLTPKGKYTVLYSFCSQSKCADGANGGWLTEGSDGNFYGQTNLGGNANQGTIYKITPSGQFTSLYSFCSQTNCTDGAQPWSQLLETSDGTFYGTTIQGGANNHGTIFKFVPGSSPTVVYSFCAQSGCSDGSGPFVGLTLANDGNFYGVTAEGGNDATTCPIKSYGCGTVFRMTPGGTLTTVYTFCTQTGCPDGQIPQGQLIQAKDGDLYGTTDGGGSSYDQGTVFKISLQGKLTTLHDFCSTGVCTDGALPYAGVIQGKDGDFYGTTGIGANIYRITSKGKIANVWVLGGITGIEAAVVQASNGKLYGGTMNGGSQNCKNGCGSIFSASTKVEKGRSSELAGTVQTNNARPAKRVAPRSL